MSISSIKPQNLPETLVWYYIIYTYPIYFLGAHFICASLLATFLTFYLIKKWWNQTEATPLEEKINISLSAWVWVVAVLVIEVALIVGHLNFNLGISQLLKSSLNWYRTWGLLALFPLAGHLNIRPQLIYRSVCIFCLQSLFMVLIGSLAGALNIPTIGYTSPLKALGGARDSYTVNLFYVFDEDEKRLQLFTPWPPSLGMVANIYFCFALQESDKKWRWLGIVGSVAMIVSSASRLGIVCLPLISGSTWLITNSLRPWVHLALGFITMVVGIISPTLLNFVDSFKEQFYKARAGSSKVRAILQRMALERWSEAPIWGHGRMEEQGPAIVGYKPIGSHHTWFGTLFAYGLVGAVAIGVALLWSLIYLSLKAQTSKTAKVGLSIVLMIILFSFSGNIEGSSYIYWPGSLMLGIAFKQDK